WAGEIRSRHTGSLVSDRAGKATTFALLGPADRGDFFIEPGSAAYAGVVGAVNRRREDMHANMTTEKRLTNMRAAPPEPTQTHGTHKNLSLEEAIEFCALDECVEVAPEAIRVRKVLLTATERAKARSRAKARNP